MNNDVICAISTPAGVGGIAVVRVSGGDSKRLTESMLRNRDGRGSRAKSVENKKNVSLADHRAKLCDFVCDGSFVDEVVALYFKAPHSYTGEDVVEISCHGSVYVQQRILQCFVDAGARMAEAGEFTLRAFMNGRMNLSQAEAVADLIDSHSETTHRLAVSQMRGGYALELESLRQELIDLAALLELELDFSDEDVEFANRDRLSDTLSMLTAKVQRLVDSFKSGNALKNGIPVAIVGRPNAGKSTLLNALLNEDRAIVSDTPGTTRDTIEERFTIDGIEFRLIDTAGIHDSDDPLERKGIERTFKALEKAAVVLFLHDSQEPLSLMKKDFESIKPNCQENNQAIYVVHTKCDIAKPDIEEGLMISARNGMGMDEVRKILVDYVRSNIAQGVDCNCEVTVASIDYAPVNDVLMTNVRHYEAMQRVLSALGEVRKGMDANLTPDLLVIDLRDALYHLGTITGQISSDEVLSSVFSRFCIGK